MLNLDTERPYRPVVKLENDKDMAGEINLIVEVRGQTVMLGYFDNRGVFRLMCLDENDREILRGTGISLSNGYLNVEKN